MVQTPVSRSAMQLVFLCLVALLIFGAAPQAGTFDECGDQLAACEDKCGSTVVPCNDGYTCLLWIEDIQQCVYWEYTGPWCQAYGVDYFECRLGEGKGICMCAY